MKRLTRAAAVALVSAVALLAFVPAATADVAPVNPVTVPLNGHPANSGFLVFVEGDAFLNADESEGTIAVGGDLSFGTTYNIMLAGSTFTAPDDAQQTAVFVGGGMDFSPSGGNILRILNSGYAKVADTSSYSAFDTDSNNAQINYRITQPGGTAESTPRIEGTVSQTPASIAEPVPDDLIDIPGAFDLYRGLSTELAGCPATIELTDDAGQPLVSPFPAGSRGHVDIVPGQTNVLTIAASDLDALGEVVFDSPPTQSAPLLVNVTGTTVNITTPNLPGASSLTAPFMLWNFAEATSITVTGGDSIEGTLYAPRAFLNWQVTQNIEGNVIASSFTHGAPGPVGGGLREIHHLPFDAQLSCVSAAEEATLTLVKEVVGGGDPATDWQLTATGDQITVTGATGSDDVTNAIVTPGTYTLSESGPTGYTPSGWTCVGATASTASTVTLENGDDAVCTITNTLQTAPPVPPDPPVPPVDPVDPVPDGDLAQSGGGDPSAAVALGLGLLIAGAGAALAATRARRAAR